jgi:hypothetical protein
MNYVIEVNYIYILIFVFSKPFNFLQKGELLSEYDIQAVLDYTCFLNGGRLAYIPVIAGIVFLKTNV